MPLEVGMECWITPEVSYLGSAVRHSVSGHQPSGHQNFLCQVSDCILCMSLTDLSCTWCHIALVPRLHLDAVHFSISRYLLFSWCKCTIFGVRLLQLHYLVWYHESVLGIFNNNTWLYSIGVLSHQWTLYMIHVNSAATWG